MTRGQSYLHRFMASLAYPSLLAAAEEDYATLDEQRRYLDSLIQEERQTLQRLEDNFVAIQEQRRYFDTSALEGLLQDAQVTQGLRRAAADAQAGRLRPDFQRLIERAAAEGPRAGLALADAALEKYPLTAEQQATARSLLADTLDPTDLERLFAIHPPVAGLAPAGVTGAEAEAARLLGEIQAAAPTSIVGGEAGEAAARARETTAAPEGSAFLTEEDAYRAALAALDADGTLSPEDFASAEDFELAKRVYTDAAAKRAYSNQDALFFERSVLDSRARLAELRRRAEEIARPAGLSRQQEVQRLVMERQGFDMDKPLARYQKSPYYDVLLAAEDMYRAGLSHTVESGRAPKGVVMQPTTRYQEQVAEYVRLLPAEPLNVRKAERQLRKLGLEGAELQSALAYAIAANRTRIEGIDSPETARAALDAQQQAKKTRDSMKRDAEAAAAAVKEAEAAAEIEALSHLTTIPGEYVRRRRAGATPEEARAAAGIIPPTEAAAEIEALSHLTTIPGEYVRRRAAGATPEEARAAAGIGVPTPAPPQAAPAPPPPAEAPKLEEERRARLEELDIEQLRQFAQKGSARAQQVLAEREAAAAAAEKPMTDAERLAALEAEFAELMGTK